MTFAHGDFAAGSTHTSESAPVVQSAAKPSTQSSSLPLFAMTHAIAFSATRGLRRSFISSQSCLMNGKPSPPSLAGQAELGRRSPAQLRGNPRALSDAEQVIPTTFGPPGTGGADSSYGFESSAGGGIAALG